MDIFQQKTIKHKRINKVKEIQEKTKETNIEICKIQKQIQTNV